jgi:CheY-like chemotaxis protein
MAKLVVITKGLPALSHELGGSWVTIGRADTNTFQIVESSVSARHCEVRLQGDELVVRDLLSTNGTFAGGKKITEGIVKTSETLRVGEVELRFDASGVSPGTASVTRMLVTGVSPKPAPATAPPSSSPLPVADAQPAGPPTGGGEPAKKYHVLFVDDSMALLETFGELCSVLSSQTWKIYSATTADRALAILQETPMDLVVLDIGIPMVDGIQLLGIIVRRYPGVKIAVMTGHATESNRAACLSNGAELFIEKPVSADGIKVVFNLLNDLISWGHREGFSGALRQVGLQEVIQMECIGRRSSILEIRNPQLRGQIYIEAGAIIHATVGKLTGEQAVYRLLSLKGGEFQVNPFQAPPRRTVQIGWENLLMEAARVSDEETVLVTKPAVPHPASAGTATVPKPAPPEQPSPGTSPPAADGQHIAMGGDIVVVATYDGKWNPAGGSNI